VKRLGRALVPVGWLLLLPVPFLVFWWAGWIHISRAHGAMVEHGVLHDTTGPGVWTALAVVYLVWAIGLTVGTIWVLDRLGYHYQPYDRPKRPTRRERRRRRAGMKYQAARQQANRDALREIALESRKAASEADGPKGGAAKGGAAKGGGPKDGGPKGAAEQAPDDSAHDAADDGGHERR
jgi:hypothetical protein